MNLQQKHNSSVILSSHWTRPTGRYRPIWFRYAFFKSYVPKQKDRGRLSNVHILRAKDGIIT